MDTKKQLCGLLSDYHLQHGRYPRRITVSEAIARSLEAEIDAENAMLFKPERPDPCELRGGKALFIYGVLIVPDMDDEFVLDVR